MTRNAIWLALALSLGGAGCGSSDEPAPAPASEPSDTVEAPSEETEEPESDEPESDEPAPTETADGVSIVGPVTLDAPVEITVPPIPGPEGQREYTLSVSTPHGVRCDAHAEHEGEGRDAQMALYRDGERIASNSDAGEGFDARIDFDAEAGTYGVRVWEWLHRDATITLTCRRHEAEAPVVEPATEESGAE